MKKSIIALMGLGLIALSACGSTDRAISQNELPKASKDFIASTFAGKSVSQAKAESDGDFEVVFADGTKVDFNAAGQWTDIEAALGDSVPVAVVPQQIVEKAAAMFPDAKIVKIEKDNYGWEVKLSNRTEMKFSTAFDLVKTEQD